MGDSTEAPDPVTAESNDPAAVTRDITGPSHHDTIALDPPVSITGVKLLSLTFTTDHRMLKDNTANWRDTGTVYSKPEFEAGKASKPISHTKNRSVGVELELEVSPPGAGPASCNIRGTATFGATSFAQTAVLSGGTVKVAASGTPLELRATVEALTGDIRWEVSTAATAATFAAGSSWGHVVFATMDTPVDVGGREGGVTHKRMQRAIALVRGTGASSPHGIVARLMSLFPGYTLIPDPSVPAKYDHPTYFNTTEGGAWPMADYIPASGECQAIVRFVRAVIKQVGCPGTAVTVVVWADPDVANGNVVLEALYPNGGLHNKSKTVGSETWYAYLVDRYPEVGKVYNIYDASEPLYMGLNNFEACLRFEQGGVTRYYGGGAGVYANKDEVILAFYALVWVSLQVVGGKDFCRVEQVVKRWRDQTGEVIP